MTEPTQALSMLEASMTEKRKAYEEARNLFREDSHALVSLKTAYHRAHALYQQEARLTATAAYENKTAQIQEAKTRHQAVVADLERLSDSLMTPEDRQALADLEREKALWRDNYLGLQKKLYSARVAEQQSRRHGAVTLLEKPTRGYRVWDPKQKRMGRLRTALTAFPVCLVLGIGAAFLREYLNSSGKLRPKVEEALEVPVIAVIPAIHSEFPLAWSKFRRPLKKKEQSEAELILAEGQLRSRDGED